MNGCRREKGILGGGRRLIEDRVLSPWEWRNRTRRACRREPPENRRSLRGGQAGREARLAPPPSEPEKGRPFDERRLVEDGGFFPDRGAGEKLRLDLPGRPLEEGCKLFGRQYARRRLDRFCPLGREALLGDDARRKCRSESSDPSGARIGTRGLSPRKK